MARLFTRFEEQMNVRSGCAPHPHPRIAHAFLLFTYSQSRIGFPYSA
jgi:hypothetical protein